MQRSAHRLILVICFGLLLAAWPVISFAQPVADEPVVEPDFGATSIGWNAPQGSGSFILVVSGPDGYHFEQTFQSGAPLAFQAVDANGAVLADGMYKYELTPVRYNLTKARSVGDDGRNPAETRELVQSQANLNANLSSLSGVFTIQNGAILDPNAVEEGTAAAQPQPASPAGIDAPADQQILDDLIVDGSACIGQDCVNGENFGFDTLRLKENNLRIKAQDTSNSASFPTVDWQLTFNESTNGGANKFSIDDIDNGRTPFTIEATAPYHSLYVDDGGRIGLGTSTPVVEMHVKDGDTPTVRLEQDGSSGFTAQTWDMAGNEAGFFVRDVTNGSTLPFRIMKTAPSQSLVIDKDGEILIRAGSGTEADASLHVKRTDGTAKILVEDTQADAAPATQALLELRNNGGATMAFADTSNSTTWEVGTGSTVMGFQINGTAPLYVTPSGATFLAGNLNISTGGCSGCRSSENAQEVTSAEVLAGLSQIPILRQANTILKDFDFSQPATTVPVDYLIPDAQAFNALYNPGMGADQIAPLDVATVALSAAQGLAELADEQATLIQQQQSIIDAQAAQLAAISARLDSVESRLESVEGMAHAHTYLPSVAR